MKKTNVIRMTLLAGVIALSSLAASRTFASPAVEDVSLTGLVTCQHCVGNQPLHKMFTRWSWALYSVNQQNDEIILVVSNKTYKLQGDRNQLAKYLEDKAIVKGRRDGTTIEVASIVRPGKTE